jgi:hypothetical protein
MIEKVKKEKVKNKPEENKGEQSDKKGVAKLRERFAERIAQNAKNKKYGFDS